MQTIGSDRFQDIRDAVRALCADFPAEYHRRIDEARGYPEEFVDALTKAGKPVQFITLDGEDHWLSRGASRQRMLAETAAFVEKHNPPN